MGFLSRFLKKTPERVRDAHFAGHLYPASADELGERVDRALKQATTQVEPGRLRALIVPFAQLDYIDDVLGACWAQARDTRIERVVLLGSALRIPFQGVAMSTVNAWRTPLGQTWVDEVWREQLQSLELVRGLDAIHEREPSLELQLPFVQRVLGEDVTVLPLLMGDGGTSEVRHILEVLGAREHTLLVVATELAYGTSHAQGDEEIARVTDAILGCDTSSIGRGAVTARHPVRALLELAREKSWRVSHLGATTSRAQQQARDEQLAVQDQGLMTGYAGFAFEG
jgi:AmmeMemoRadiSam system protein B